MNNGKRDPDEVRRKLIEARIHLDFCAELYQMQIDAGRYYVHEHPTSARSNWLSVQLRATRPQALECRMAYKTKFRINAPI